MYRLLYEQYKYFKELILRETMGKKFILAIIFCSFLLLAACGDDVVVMPAQLCQATCTDDGTGKVYAIAMRGLAWNNEDDDYGASTDLGCRIYVDRYAGEIDENGNFISVTPELLSDFSGTSSSSSYISGYNFLNTAISIEDYLLYQLLDESTLSVGSTATSLYAKYTHQINTCVLDANLELELYCNSNEDTVSARCDITYGDGSTDSYYIENPNKNDVRCPSGSSCTEDINSEDIATYHPDIQEAITEVENS